LQISDDFCPNGLANNSLVIEAGRTALWFVGWAVVMIIAFDTFISSIPSSSPPWLIIWQGILPFLVLTLVPGYIVVSIFFRMLGSAKKPRSSNRNDWVLLITILGAAFAIGGIFQAVSTIGSQTVSVSSCASPSKVNVTSPNCVRTQTITHTEGPNLYFAQMGLYMIALAIAGALGFGMSYVALFLKMIASPEQ
jgi:hypothetical protein